MLLDVGNFTRNIVLNACFYGIVLVTLFSLVPWRLKAGGNRWTLYLPLAALALYGTYEMTMPSNWDIRLDLLLIIAMGTVIILAWGIRLALRARAAREKR